VLSELHHHLSAASAAMPKKVLPGNLRQARTNYRCSDQGLAGFACRTSTAPDSGQRQNQPGRMRNPFLKTIKSKAVTWWESLLKHSPTP
jgi:hypothetical protein